MGRNTRLAVSLVIVGSLVLLADYLFLHLLFPMKKAALMQELNARVESALHPTKNAAGASAPGDQAQSPTESTTATSGAALPANTFKEELSKCLPGATDENPTELAKRYASQLKTSDLVVENVHLVLPNGEERRLMTIPSDRDNAKNRPEVRWFKVDAEGLPVPLKLNSEDAFDPKPEFIEKLKGEGRVIFQQRKESNTYGDGTHALVEWIDGSVREFQLRLPHQSLNCLNLDCRCQ